MAKKPKGEAATVLVVAVSDIHAASTVSLCPPSVPLDDGGSYTPSKAQAWLWANWLDFWGQVETLRDELGAQLWLVFNGDLYEGDHHSTSQLISRNPVDWQTCAAAIFDVPFSLKPDHAFVVRGTETHTGRSASSEEGMARAWREMGRPIVEEPGTKNASWWHLRFACNGVRFDCGHHGRTGHREHTRQNAANLYAHDILLAHVKDGDPPPDIAIRSHYHKWLDSGDAAKVLRLIGLPAWQLKTGFAQKVALDSLSDIGGLVVVVGDGEYEARKIHYQPERGPVWRP